MWKNLKYLCICHCLHLKFIKLRNSKLGSTQQWMAPTCCQDHILTENIWFVWSETSYSGDERRCYRCGTTKQTNEHWRSSYSANGSWRLSFAKFTVSPTVYYYHHCNALSKTLLASGRGVLEVSGMKVTRRAARREITPKIASGTWFKI